MKKLICYSLWGDDPKYNVGAIRNAEQIKDVYPGWVARFYCGQSVPHDTIEKLSDLNAEVIMMDAYGDWDGMFWRFFAIADSDVEIMLSRDTDSRLTLREKSAVDEWLRSDKLFHIMRDHPEHNAQIMGGMWGARKPILQDMTHLINKHKRVGDINWQVDQIFLRDIIYPRIINTALVHDEFFDNCPYPTPRIDLEFIGQVFDENEETVQEHLDSLAAALT